MKTSHNQNSLPNIKNSKIAILQSKWHRQYTDNMVKKCVELLKSAEVEEISLHIASGCLEMPLMAKRLAQAYPDLEAIITIGVILKGDTYHFEMITDETIRGLGNVMLECDMPIIVEILPVNSIDHVIARSSDDEFNKGIEAAIAAAESVAWRRANPICR